MYRAGKVLIMHTAPGPCLPISTKDHYFDQEPLSSTKNHCLRPVTVLDASLATFKHFETYAPGPAQQQQQQGRQ